MSTLPILISAIAAAVELVVGLLCLAFAAAPGWKALRWFAGIALTAAAYSLGNLAFVLPVPDDLVVWAGRLNFLWATAHVSCWIGYSRVQVGKPIRRWEWLLGAGLVSLGALALIPDLAIRSEPLLIQELPRLGIAYRVPINTILGEATAALAFALITVPVVRYGRRARARIPGAVSHLVAFGIFYVAAALETAATLRLLQVPFLVDVGFLSVVLAVSGEMARRVTRNARLLTLLTEQLEDEVEARTRDLMKAREALVQSERQAALGQLAAGIGHEINNPLTYVVGNLEHLRESMDGSEDAQLVDEALEGSKRIGRIVRQLKLFARPMDEEPQPVDVRETLDAALQLVQHDLRHRARVVQKLSPVRPVLADPSKLGQVFVNLLVNAAHAMADGDPKRNVVTVRTRGENGAVVIDVSDTGRGIDPKILPHIFDPYFTTKPHGQGTGLGLSIVRNLVGSMGGTIEARSEPGRGTVFRVMLPAYTGARSVHRSPPPEARTRHLPRRSTGRPRRRVLIVDDEPLVARALRRNLRGMDVDLATSGEQALEAIGRDGAYDAIVCDLMMPDLSGMDLYDHLLETHPELARRTLFITGGTVTDRARRFLDRDDIAWLPKPVDTAALRRMIDRLTSRPASGNVATHRMNDDADVPSPGHVGGATQGSPPAPR